MDPVLFTIAIPTFNRAKYLKKNLEQLKSELSLIQKDFVEIIVSDNCSTDNTKDVVEDMIDSGLQIRYICNETNIGWGLNFLQCFDLAKGKYVLLLGDDDLLFDGALKIIIDKLINQDYGILCLHPYGFNDDYRKEYPGSFGTEKVYNNSSDFLLAISPVMRAISACIINKQHITHLDIRNLPISNFAHLHLILPAILKAEKNLFIDKYMVACKRNNSFGYNFSKVFVEEYWQLLDEYKSFGLKIETIQKLENAMLFTYYPYYLLVERLEGKEDRMLTLKYFSDRFKDRFLFKFWVAPILKWPKPFALTWGYITVVIGRIYNKELLRGFAFLWKSVIKTNKIHMKINQRKYQICTNCVMDTSDSKIVFDEKGVCDHCNDFNENVLPHWHTDDKGRAEMERVVAQIKKEGKGKEFDCILGMSGGVDSSYLLHLAVTELGLRPLVFHVDGGWNSELAVHNIQVMVDQLGLDLYTEVINWEEMKDFQLAFFKSGVPHLDIPQDHAFIATLYNFANKYNIKYILNGGNISTECVRNPMEWLYYGTDMSQIRDIRRQFSTNKMETYPFSPVLKHKFYLRYIKGVQVVKPLNYMPYVKEDALKMLADTYGWTPYPQKHFESRFTKFYEGYWLPERFGFDTRRVQFSSLILTGQLKREEALEQLKRPAFNPETIDDEFNYIATKLGITPLVLREYFNMPKKFYWHYKNQEKLFNIGAKILKFIGVEKSIKH